MKSGAKRSLATILEGKLKPIAAIISALGVIIGGCMGVASYVSARVDEQFETHLAPVEEQIEELHEQSLESKNDRVRQQFLTIIYHQPENTEAVLKIAQVYFVELKQDWYMTTIFLAWADQYNITVPSAIMEQIALAHSK